MKSIRSSMLFKSVRSGHRGAGDASASGPRTVGQREIHSYPRSPLGKRASCPRGCTRSLCSLRACRRQSWSAKPAARRSQSCCRRQSRQKNLAEGSRLVLTRNEAGESFVSALYLGTRFELALFATCPRSQAPAAETAKLGPIAESAVSQVESKEIMRKRIRLQVRFRIFGVCSMWTRASRSCGFKPVLDPKAQLVGTALHERDARAYI